jgi:hypothetical protein
MARSGTTTPLHHPKVKNKIKIKNAGGTRVMDDAARLLAVEVLLTAPEALGNDALETDLYILRDQLRGTPADAPARP